MFASRLFLLTTLVACGAVTSHKCYAQPNGHAYGLEGIVSENDLRWFEPADLDLDGRLEKEAGYFLRVNKEGLFISGERAEIGDPDTVVTSERLFSTSTIETRQKIVDAIYANTAGSAINLTQLENDLGVTFQEVGGVIVTKTMVIDVVDDQGVGGATTIEVPVIGALTENPPEPYIVRNSIKDATPQAELGWGEEYEFGHSDGERGWVARILDGPEVNSGGIYGAGEGSPYTSQSGTDFAGFDPYYGGSPQDLDGDGVLDVEIAPGELYALGFGSVAVNFDAPEDFFVGFRDYIINTQPTSGTQFGIINYIGNYGGVEDNEDFDDDGDDEIGGIADDLDGDLDSLFIITVDTDGDGDPDTQIGTITDFGDLYKFNVFFDEVSVSNRVELDGAELMFTHEIDRGHKLDRGRRDDLQIRYGASFLRFRDEFNFEGLGSILGRTSVEHVADNQLVGPSFGVRWRRDHGRWDFAVDTQVTLAYNIVDHRQNGIFGEELIPGALNRPINGRTYTNIDSLNENDFSPIAELRLQARYKITKALALTAGYKAKFIDNIQRSSNAIYYSPEFGIRNEVTDVFINGLTMGVEFRH